MTFCGCVLQVIVRNSGHMVPSDKPEWALKMMELFVFDKPFTEYTYVYPYV